MLTGLRCAFAVLFHKPGFALMAVLTLAVGIGATTTIFSVADAILWKSVPLPDPSRLVMVMERRVEQQSGWIPVSPANFLDWKAQSRSYEHLAGYEYSSANLTAAESYLGAPERLASCLVTPDLFAALGATPALGRVFSADEAQPGADREVVLSYKYWVRRFNQDPAVLGKTVHIDGRDVTVIGVMPAHFEFPPATDIWMPLALPAPVWHLRPAPQMFVLARLKPGISIAEARAEMNGIAQRLEHQSPRTNRGWRTTVLPMRDFLMGGLLTQYTWMLLGVVGFVLLIACANVANLQFARATGRVREIAVRTALGATRGRLVRQLLAESVVLSLAGAALGLRFAVWGVDFFRTGISPEFVQDIPNWTMIHMDARALAFTILVAVSSGILSGLAPAFQSVGQGAAGLSEALKEGARSASTSRGRLHLRNVFVAADVALALMLLVGAGLMTKGLARLINREQNVQPDTLLTLRINLPASKYGDSRKAVDFYSQLLARVTNLPGVASAAIANVIPHSGTNAAITAFKREGTPEVEPGEQNLCEYASISPGYMRTVRIALRQGRGFIDSDGANAPAVALISERLARRFWPGEDPLGKRVSIGRASSFGPGMTIVGVVADVVQNSFDREARFVIYVPYAQDPLTNMHLAVRTYGDPSAVVNAIEAQVQGLDREQPVYQVKTLGRLMDDQVTGLRYIAVLMSIFGGLALLLASVGVYGVMSYAVSERTREIGVRIALGARKRDVLALVVGRGMLIALAGVSTGLAGAFALARVLSGLIFGISSTDAPTFAGVALLLTVVTLVASYVPARRATRVDPITALRYE